MRPLVLHQPIAAIPFWASLALWVFVIEPRVRAHTDSSGQTTREWTYTFIGVMVLVGIVASIEAASHHVAPFPGPAWWPVVVGLIIMWGGIAFRFWAIFTLGRFFKVVVIIQDDHRLIDHGPYRWIRHPSYLGFILTMTGIGVAEGDWASAAIMPICGLIGFLTRIRIEERILLQEFGAEYTAYVQRTARLIPGLF